MGLWMPPSQRAFGWRVSNISSLRPATSIGATITPGNNSKGSWVEVLTAAQVSREIVFLSMYVGSLAAATFARDGILDVGVDPAGGTSYAVVCPDLLIGNAATASYGPRGVNYQFPIRIPAGSSVAARASVNNATPGTCRVVMRGFGSPRDRANVKAGSHVTSYGVNAGTSTGTAITSGTTSEGSWTSLGTISRDEWFWQLGICINVTPYTVGLYHADLAVGDATNKIIVVEDLPFLTGSGNNDLAKMPQDDGFYRALAGQTVYGRLQCNTTPLANISMAAYGVGG